MTDAQPDLLDHLDDALQQRSRPLNDAPCPDDGAFVLYWMRVALRGHDNPALDAAITLSHALDRPLLVYHALSERYPFASDRHHRFILEGARDVQAEFAQLGIPYVFHLERPDHRGDHLLALTQRASVLITEMYPWQPLRRWTARVAETPTPCIEVDASCLVPVPEVPAGARDRAFRFRKATATLREQTLLAPPETLQPRSGDALPELPFEPLDLQQADLAALVAECAVDHQVGPVPHTPGGSNAGYARWERFRDGRLRRYHRGRNDPLADAVSRLSPYLHYGQVSPFRIAREAFEIGGGGADKFLDELLIWREMSWAWCHHSRDHDSLDALPEWARETLTAHADDPREALFDAEALARGRTGDALWDAAQRSLLTHGELHNNLRMTWGKMVPQWTADPDTALRTLIDLNHRYALDGRDPNSYGGLLWCLGGFDRPFDPERPVLGRVRPRDTATHAKRLDVDAYAARVRQPARSDPPRVAVIGAGIAGLAAARTLVDHGWSVTVFDKGRRPGGRLATRSSRSDPAQFDHGAPGFATSDRRFKRLVAAWRERGLVQAWSPRGPDGETTSLWVPTPDAAALGAHLATDLDLRCGTRVTALQRREPGWRLTLDDGGTVDVDALLCALPQAQLQDLLADTDVAAPPAPTLQPCWSLLVRTPKGTDPGFDLARPAQPPLALVIREASKPGRSDTGAFTAHANADFSQKHLEAEPEQVVELLLDALQQQLGAAIDPADIQAHRWRYAHAAGGEADPQQCWFDPDAALVACGDWLGPAHEAALGVEAAWLSGSAAAGRLLGADLPGHPYAGDLAGPWAPDAAAASQDDLFGASA